MGPRRRDRNAVVYAAPASCTYSKPSAGKARVMCSARTALPVSRQPRSGIAALLLLPDTVLQLLLLLALLATAPVNASGQGDCPAAYAYCAMGEQTTYAKTAVANPPPKDSAASPYSALFGAPTYRVGGLLCLPDAPNTTSLQSQLWSLTSGSGNAPSGRSKVAVAFSRMLYAKQVRARRGLGLKRMLYRYSKQVIGEIEKRRCRFGTDPPGV